ncbi:MAG TPA: YqgE/AlgH family protein [Cyclobacteriaceae bacterium]|jgi:putative transcriptional regulator
MNEYFDYKNNVLPQKGRLLISEPYLLDPNFERTVILLCEHNEEGSFGFVINKPSSLKFEEVVEGVSGFNENLYVGGPVQQDTLHFIHCEPELVEGGIEIDKGLFWGGDFEKILTLIDIKKVDSERFRFFIGYSGWSPGQLEKEIEENSWIVSPGLKADLLFTANSDDLWKLALNQLGGRFKIYSNYPVNPRLN